MSGAIEAILDKGINVVTDPIEDLGQKVYKIAEVTIEAIKRDPIGTLLPTALAFAGVPPVLSSSLIGLSRGQNIGQIATQALISTGVKNFSGYTWGGDTSLNDITSSIAESIGGYDAIQSAVTSGLNNAAFNGVLALAQGKSAADIRDAITSGFGAGALTSGANSLTTEALSYFKDAQDGMWGFSGKQLELIKGGVNTALIAGVSGQDIGKAISAYAANAAYQAAKGKTTEFLKTAVNDANEAIKNYNIAQNEFNTALDKAKAQDVLAKTTLLNVNVDGTTGQSLLSNMEVEAANFQSYKEQADAAEAAGDYAKQNEYAKLANASAENYQKYSAQLEQVMQIAQQDPNAVAQRNVGEALSQRAEQKYAALQDKDPTELVNLANEAQKEYDTAVSEAATKQFLIDQINTGNLAPLNYDQDSGIYDFGNGLTYNGQDFYQNGEKIFTNTSDFEFAPVNIQGTPDIPATEETGGTFVQMEPAQPQAVYVPADDGAEDEPQTVEFTEEDAPVEEEIDWMNVGDEGGVEDVEGEEGSWVDGIFIPKIPRIPVSTTPKPAPAPAPAPAPKPAATPAPTANTPSPQNLAALLALLDQPQQVQQEPVQDPYAHIQSPMGDLFGSTLNVNAAQGGSINDLLRILRG